MNLEKISTTTALLLLAPRGVQEEIKKGVKLLNLVGVAEVSKNLEALSAGW